MLNSSWRLPHWMLGHLRPRPDAGDPPLRGELFSAEQLSRHAQSLATLHQGQVITRKGTNQLLSRLVENEEILRAFNGSTLHVNAARRITAAAEWLLDNFYLIEEQIQMTRHHLPRGYSRELPRLASGASAGMPRVYDIVLELISHVDAQIDPATLQSFIAAYQTVVPLKLGELWAIPIMVRLGLIENLQRVATRLNHAREDRDLADLWVDRLRDMAEKKPSHLVVVVADMAQASLPVSSPFVAEFCQRLSLQSPVLHFARSWLEQRLVEQGFSIEELVHQESQHQAADQVSVSHSIASLRLLSASDWKEFVEGLSEVETLLREDPAGVYRTMDFATRDRYRHSVEFFARHGSVPEAEVARRAIQLAGAAAATNNSSDRTAPVGYVLIDTGQTLLGKSVDVRWPWRSVIDRTLHRFPLAFYTGGIAGLTLLATFGFVQQSRLADIPGWRLVFFTAVFFWCASQLSVAVINWLATLLVKPRLLPRLDCSAGILPGCRTMVVVPTLLTSTDGVNRLIDALEIHYLANRDPLLHFALLTDFQDAAAEHTEGDQALLDQVRNGIQRMSDKYRSDRGDLFFLFHRPRRWNPSEGLWMGYERKRGKITEFNAMLRGGDRSRFSESIGQIEVLPSVRYVITLDTDTQLPRDAARQLVGTMAHPLNRPRFDPVHGVVAEGYSILQPRVGVSLPSARRSWFVRLFSGDVGIDPYTREVSDVYQDLFCEGSFIGKGIYDVDAFHRALQGRFPENTVLSHDLLEACHARSALVSDVEFYEEFPSRYNVDMDRRHRWIRGDWQITQWLLPRVPGADARWISNPLSVLSRWKIFDNLRRSLVPVALMLLILGEWLLTSQGGGGGSLLVLVIVAIPGILSWSVGLIGKPAGLPWSLHLSSAAGSGTRQLCSLLLTVIFLPYDAFISLDAVGRTLSRLLITHKRMLEWRTSGDSERSTRVDLIGFYRTMWIAPAIAILSAGALLLEHPVQFLPALPILVVWLGAPGIAWWISRPIALDALDLTAAQLEFLRGTARRTWHYFDTFVTADENWLPPDNFQETPAPTIAARTSPTNIGLSLLANLAAHDLGYVSTGRLVQRTQDTLATLHRLESYRGHFFNWYDTRTLRPLLPQYVSSVDSGNLAGHLLTLGSGLRELESQPIFDPKSLLGLRDTVTLLLEALPGDAVLSRLKAALEHVPAGFRAAWLRIQLVESQVAQFIAALQGQSELTMQWAEALRRQCDDQLEELRRLAPWLEWVPPAAAESVSTSRHDMASVANASASATATASTARSVKEWLQVLDTPPSLTELATWESSSERHFESLPEEWVAGLHAAGTEAARRIAALKDLARDVDSLAAMDFTFLFDVSRDLFSTGFHFVERRCDASYYDLLASEARLCSYVAIALGQIPQEHWFSMGRLLVASHGEPVLVSWSGSMFEYLMPLLVMPNYENTLLDHTCRAAVQHQIEYGRLRGVPWGISESGYNRTDVHLNYQYRAFGVPGLGLKRGLAEDLVIAPYASAMALMVAPRSACENLERLAREGRCGSYGFHEAVDYTPARLPPEETSVTICSFMAHHQGMSLLALASVLCDAPMQRRFLGCPILKAADLLLQERVPRTAATVLSADLKLEESRRFIGDGEAVMRIFTDPATPAPEVHLLSNGRYHVAVTSAGGGYSRWRDIAITRWKEDSTRDCWGSFVYLRDLETGEFWSTTLQPTLRTTQGYEAIFTQARAEFRHRYSGLEIHTQISISPEDDVELRRITLTNRTSTPRVIELTSYSEVVLATAAADAAHPAFSNLFVQTEFLPNSTAVVCTRRPRSVEEQPPWLIHLLLIQGSAHGEFSCETDRNEFVGRDGTLVSPAALRRIGPLSNTVGSVLDPIVSLRQAVSLPAHGTATVDLVLGVSDSRGAALAQLDQYQSARRVDRAFDLAWTHSQVTLHQLNVTETEAQLFGRLASALIYADPARRAGSALLASNRRGQNGLWSYGISGDAPIVLLRISQSEKLEMVRQLILAHSYWRAKGLTVDLVILNEDVSIYRQSLHEEIIGLIASSIGAQLLDKPGGIFARRLEQIPNDDRVLLQAAARVVLDDEKGSLEEQMAHRSVLEPVVSALRLTRFQTRDPSEPLPPRTLTSFNGLGGFTAAGDEYVIVLEDGRTTPAPWINVLANPHFGTVTSESGSTYTWSENAHEFRLTPWTNDPVLDTPGEAFYIRDDQTGQFWSPTPSPARGSTPYIIRHGFGYTVYEHTEHGISSELWIYVTLDAPVKFATLKLRNLSNRSRRLSITGYWEWVLGELRHKSLLHVQTEVDVRTGALLARNDYNTDFPERLVFLDVNDANRTLTGDRKEFLGRNGTLATPAAMKRTRLSGKVGAGLDPCGAVQVSFTLSAGQERETTFRLGVGRGAVEVQHLIRRFRRADAPRQALDAVRAYWKQTLSAITLETPDPTVNLMANGWLLYQTLSARIWGRTGFFQSGGAFGFRDQLQDVLALVHAEPSLTREHLLRAASHQFLEGDVQHWWHPPQGRGVRTHFSDDFLWLPYVTGHYVARLADTGVLDERIPFLEGRSVAPEEEAYYDLPTRSEQSATLYEHCVRAIEHGLRFGEHGLPLIGCGDWNDGMNKVGNLGRGESVWLGFFLFDVLTRFAPIARARHEDAFADRCLAEASTLQANLEKHAWDGDWYLRAYFDNGDPLGSHLNSECQIDSIPQSWSVISGAASNARALQAMNSVDHRLVRRDAQLVQLFDPPFNTSTLNPGYIKGYIPGVRENGGQYTHGAIWAAMAYAQLEETDRAWELVSLLNPVRHGGTAERIAVYRVEPYVIAADVYAVAPHVGRGGWTWYTGSAGWMYRLLVETLAGLNLEGTQLRLTPKLPTGWPGFTMSYRYRKTVYRITVQRAPDRTTSGGGLTLDGLALAGDSIPLVDDQLEHQATFIVAALPSISVAL